jgi:hypothetical protein
MRLIAKATADNTATIDWALPPGLNVFRIVADGYLPATDWVFLVAQVSTDGGSNYAASDYINPFGFAGQGGDHGHSNGGTVGFALVQTRNTSASKSGVSDGILTGAAAGLIPRYIGQCAVHHTNGGMYVFNTVGEYTGGTDRVTHIRLKATSGNITSGKFYLYGE